MRKLANFVPSIHYVSYVNLEVGDVFLLFNELVLRNNFFVVFGLYLDCLFAHIILVYRLRVVLELLAFFYKLFRKFD